MLFNRVFTIIVAIALLAVIGLTVSEVAATVRLVSQAGSIESTCASLPSRHSIRTEYVPERGVWMTYTESGPTGVDGGLIQLLSDYQDCSR